MDSNLIRLVWYDQGKNLIKENIRIKEEQIELKMRAFDQIVEGIKFYE